MSSIAYIVDKKMIEFHRLRGHQTMNFWRLNTSKKFQDFHQGDLLFFLTKTKERPNEKGIVGYGRLQDSYDMSITKMWNQFGKLNGYLDKESFKQAVYKIAKGAQVKQLSSLYLKEVTFFQTPVYLSDVGYPLSKSVESFIYVDKYDSFTSSKVLQRAKADGLDAWAAIFFEQEDKEKSFEEAEVMNALNKVQARIKEVQYSEYEHLKARRLLKRYMMNHPKINYCQNTLLTGYRYQQAILTLYQPVIASKDEEDNMKRLLGQQLQYQHYIECFYPYHIEIKFVYIEKEMKEVSLLKTNE
ncbi:MAG: hypothetical protein R3Y57_00920 [Erysipelotrichaceae bacterium]